MALHLTEQQIKTVLALKDLKLTEKQIALALSIQESDIQQCLEETCTQSSDLSDEKSVEVEALEASSSKSTAGDSFNFTKEKLLKIALPESNRTCYRDSKEKGLIVMVFSSGAKVFYLYKKIEGKPHRIRIGPFPDLSVQDAREKAMALKNEIAKGNNPVSDKALLSNELTFKELFDKYINDYAKHNTKTWKEDIAEMERKAKHFYNLKMSEVGRDDVYALFNKLTNRTGKISANRFLDRLKAIFNKAIEWGWDGKNPTAGIKKHREIARDRYLTSEEIPRFFEALEDEENEKVKDFILMALYTGARKSNVLAMKWENISFDNKTWYIPETKNGLPQLVPLVDEALEVLANRKKDNETIWVFPSETSRSGHLQEPKKVWARILRMAGIKNFRIHDLRRTLGSWMAHTGASQYVIGKGLNHKSPQSTAIYARLSIDPVRESINKATQTITEIRNKASGK